MSSFKQAALLFIILSAAICLAADPTKAILDVANCAACATATGVTDAKWCVLTDTESEFYACVGNVGDGVTKYPAMPAECTGDGVKLFATTCDHAVLTATVAKKIRNLTKWGGTTGCGGCLVRAVDDPKLKWCVGNGDDADAFRDCVDSTQETNEFQKLCKNGGTKRTLYPTATASCEPTKATKNPTTGGDCEKCIAAQRAETTLKWCATATGGDCKAEACTTGETPKTECPSAGAATTAAPRGATGTASSTTAAAQPSTGAPAKPTTKASFTAGLSTVSIAAAFGAQLLR